MRHRLLAAVVPHGRGPALAAAANEAGAGGGTLLVGQGTAPNAVLQLLGLGGSAKDLFLTVTDESLAERVRAVLRAAAARAGRAAGVLFTSPVARFVRFGLPENAAPETPPMPEQPELLALVVNKGFAEDAMAAARKAGATGGTILPARGTARPDDETFFGVRLVPEKELLLVAAPAAAADAALEAVRALPCFAERGSGVAFRVPLASFDALGAAAAAAAPADPAATPAPRKD